jgi:hypothetical protein
MSQKTIKAKIEAYRSKRYRNDIIRGGLIFLFISIITLFGITLLEDQFWFGSTTRMILFLGLLIISGFWAVLYVFKPIVELYRLRKGINSEDLAREIGFSFPEVKDKLLNYLQLSEDPENSQLTLAALDQKKANLQLVNFESSINIKKNLKYFYWLIILLTVVALAAFVSPSLVSDSPQRIINFNKEYNKPAPFLFLFEDSDYQVFVGESYTTSFKLIGANLPDEVILFDGKRTSILQSKRNGSYDIIFKNLREDIKFNVQAAGFNSQTHLVKTVPRPELIQLSLALDYPEYTGLESKKAENTGSHLIPEGTKITWSLEELETSHSYLINDTDTLHFRQTGQSANLTKHIFKDYDYQILLKNSFGTNKTPISYTLNVIKDQLPDLDLTFIPDTILFKNMIINGSINDDYGFTALYASIKEIETNVTHTVDINFSLTKSGQSFIQLIDIEPFMKNSGSLEITVTVKDNDQINGPKSTKSKTFYFDKPDESDLKEKVAKQSEQTENNLERSKNNAQELSKELNDLDNKLKSKKDLGWQEEKIINKILKDREKIEQQLKEIQKEHEELLQMQDKFDPLKEGLKEKSKELQKLIDELLDEETKKLYEELQKLLADEADAEKVKDQISKINKKEQNLEQELERTLELFKRMKLEAQIQKTANDLEKLGAKQNDLSEEKINEEQSAKQDLIKQEFDAIQEKLEDISQLNQELKSPEPISDFNQEAKDLDEKLNEISKDLESGDQKNTKQKQKNAANQMKEMAAKMQQMQSGMEMEMMEENMQDLENIVDNLIKLSFEEERLIKDFQEVTQVDPRFLELSQDQLKLIKNAEVVKDSLVALAGRVAQISNFITREVTEIDDNLKNAMDELRERNKNKATSHQQYAMTSMNNLALLLGDVLEQMQMAMSEAMGNPKPGDKQQKGLPNMSQLQQQLSKQIQELKKSGKSGRQLSEELAKLAAEQSMLRQQMQQLQDQLEGQPENSGTSKSLKEIIEKMEQNETDLVNKRLTNNLLNRQEDIQTRMLEATESLREQQERPEREAESANDNYNKLTPAFEEYLKAKQAEIELLKTIPLDLSPFYKKEVNDYFKRLSVDN